MDVLIVEAGGLGVPERTPGSVNLSLTITALGIRLAEHLVAKAA